MNINRFDESKFPELTVFDHEVTESEMQYFRRAKNELKMGNSVNIIIGIIIALIGVALIGLATVLGAIAFIFGAFLIVFGAVFIKQGIAVRGNSEERFWQR